MLYIFDIDGTLSDNSHRLHLIQGEVKDWEGFHNAMGDDKPIFEVITIARALGEENHKVVYSTGRMLKGLEVTQRWLCKYRLPQVGRIYMRSDGDHREDFEVKAELLEKIKLDYPSSAIGGAFEDRQQMVDMYRARGIRAFQVAKGDY